MSEPSVARLASGDLLAVFRQDSTYAICASSDRAGGGAPLMSSRSTDDGLTWSQPQPLVGQGLSVTNTRSVDPQLTSMPGGQLLLTYGRPNTRTLVSEDEGASTWTDLTVTNPGVTSGYASERLLHPRPRRPDGSHRCVHLPTRAHQSAAVDVSTDGRTWRTVAGWVSTGDYRSLSDRTFLAGTTARWVRVQVASTGATTTLGEVELRTTASTFEDDVVGYAPAGYVVLPRTAPRVTVVEGGSGPVQRPGRAAAGCVRRRDRRAGRGRAAGDEPFGRARPASRQDRLGDPGLTRGAAGHGIPAGAAPGRLPGRQRAPLDGLDVDAALGARARAPGERWTGFRVVAAGAGADVYVNGHRLPRVPLAAGTTGFTGVHCPRVVWGRWVTTSTSTRSAWAEHGPQARGGRKLRAGNDGQQSVKTPSDVTKVTDGVGQRMSLGLRPGMNAGWDVETYGQDEWRARRRTKRGRRGPPQGDGGVGPQRHHCATGGTRWCRREPSRRGRAQPAPGEDN